MLVRLLAIGLLFFSTTTVMAENASDQLKKTVDTILGVLIDTTIDKAAKRKKIAEFIATRFDFRTMSQQILATNWKKASDEQQKRFVQLFSELLQESYVGRIEAYTNEKIEFKTEKPDGNRTTIETVILTRTANIPVHYKMLPQGEKWLVYDVVIEGISFVRSYRGMYQDIVKKDGIDGLLKQMSEKIASMRGEKTTN